MAKLSPEQQQQHKDFKRQVRKCLKKFKGQA